MYSASVVDKAVMVCILDVYVIGLQQNALSILNKTWKSLDRCGHPFGTNFRRSRHPPNNQSATACWGGGGGGGGGGDNYTFVMCGQEVMANSFDCFGMTFLWTLREASALMFTHRDIRLCGLLQEVHFAYDAVVVKVRRHVWAVGVLMKQIGGHFQVHLGIGPASQL